MSLENLLIEATQSSPEVRADVASGTLAMSGDSYPENSYEFFAPVIAWLEGMITGSDRPVHLELRLMYMNTSSVKAMMDILDMLEESHVEQGREVAVNWYYDPRNERVVEMIEEFQEDCTFPFRILPESL